MKRKVSFYAVGIIWSTPAFLFFIILFLCGVIAGGCTGLLGRDAQTVSQLADYLIHAAQGNTPLTSQFTMAVLSAAAWLAICIGAGLLTPASLFLGAVVAARSFSLAFTVAVMVTQLGLRGLLLSFIATGAAAVVTVPCLLLIATAAHLAAQEAPQGQRTGYFYALRRYRGAIALCFALSLAAAALRTVLAPIALARLF